MKVLKMTNKEFVDYVFRCVERDKGARASLRKADSESQEWKAWSIIYPAIENLEAYSRPIYSMIASAIAKSRMEKDGTIKLGEAVRVADGVENGETSKRMLRLLSVSDSEELLMVMRRLLPYLISKGIDICFTSLLSDLKAFEYGERKQEVKARWMNDYLRRKEDD